MAGRKSAMRSMSCGRLYVAQPQVGKSTCRHGFSASDDTGNPRRRSVSPEKIRVNQWVNRPLNWSVVSVSSATPRLPTQPPLSLERGVCRQGSFKKNPNPMAQGRGGGNWATSDRPGSSLHSRRPGPAGSQGQPWHLQAHGRVGVSGAQLSVAFTRIFRRDPKRSAILPYPVNSIVHHRTIDR